jgi:protein-S-isoprenylcysteine O-methyltransferase Ste14
MNKFIDLIWCFGFLALVWWMAYPLIERQSEERKLCAKKGGAYVTVQHSQAYCAPRVK